MGRPGSAARIGNCPASAGVALAAASAGLHRDSVVNVSQVVTLDKSDPSERVGVGLGL